MSEPWPRHVSMSTMVLVVLLAVATTAAVFFATRTPSGPAPTITVDGKVVETTPVPVSAFTQTDTVSPRDRYTGQVFYPIPYSSPPSLKIKCDDPKRSYDVAKEDEFGFTWMIRPSVDDFSEAFVKANKSGDLLSFTFESIGASNFKSGLRFADFTYEARGVRGSGRPAKPFEQTGTFNTAANADGEVIYPIPYAEPANVELSGQPSSYVVVVESRANGFKWRNKVDKTWESFASGSVKWVAKGVRK